MNYREIITSPVWYYLPKKKKGISEYGDSGICGISVSIEKCSTSSCCGKLQSHLADVEEQAQELFDHLMKQRAEREGITEKLKADNQMEWVGRMSNLRSAVTETVNAEVIFV
jgi:hypothetical protein